MSRLIAPVFEFEGNRPVNCADRYTRLDAPDGQLALTGPSAGAPPGHLPVRGDLAHIKYAGRYFVPHYAVPMPHSAKADGTHLHATASPEADVLCTLAKGGIFDVLDIAGGWAWGQTRTGNPQEDGDVGYIVMRALEAIAP